MSVIGENDNADDAFATLIGQDFAAVTFIWNYYQFLIGIDTLSIYCNPLVSFRGKTHRKGDPEYRDALCARIGSTVAYVLSDEGHLEFTLSDGSVIYISFSPEERVDPALQESLVLTNPNGNIISVGDSKSA